MTNIIKFSVIIPSYNAEKYISSCLDSIINTGYDNIEIIIVDDNSTDSTSRICHNYAEHDHRIRCISNCGPSGPASARNCGLMQAKGDYVIFVDSDDEITSCFFQKLEDVIHNHNPEIIIGDASRIDEFGNLSNNYWKDMSTFMTKDDIVQSCIDFMLDERKNRILCSVWAKAFQCEFLKSFSVKFDEKLCTYEDELFFFQSFTKSSRCYYMNEIVYRYYRNRANIGSSSVTHNPTAFKYTLKVIKDFLSMYIEDVDFLNKLYSQAYCEYSISACYHIVRLMLKNKTMDKGTILKQIENVICNRDFCDARQYYSMTSNSVNSPKVISAAIVCDAEQLIDALIIQIEGQNGKHVK